MAQEYLNQISKVFNTINKSNIVKTCELSVFAMFVAISLNVMVTNGFTGRFDFWFSVLYYSSRIVGIVTVEYPGLL